MKIEEVINLWNKSKYETLMLKSMPCVNHLGEITYGTSIYKKGQIIMCGGSYKVEDYLIKIYKGSIFMLEKVKDYICFKIILRGSDSDE